jgi:hypothetical protein
MYFLQELDLDAGKFFIYFLFIYITTFCITALYRMFAALSPTIDDAVRFSGIALNLLIIYTGYVIPKPQLLQQYIWFGWIYFIKYLGPPFTQQDPLLIRFPARSHTPSKPSKPTNSPTASCNAPLSNSSRKAPASTQHSKAAL